MNYNVLRRYDGSNPSGGESKAEAADETGRVRVVRFVDRPVDTLGNRVDEVARRMVSHGAVSNGPADGGQAVGGD